MTLRYLRELGERALKTFAQVLAATLIAGATTNIVSMPWASALLLAIGAAVLSVITSVASAPWGDENTPSLVRADDDAP